MVTEWILTLCCRDHDFRSSRICSIDQHHLNLTQTLYCVAYTQNTGRLVIIMVFFLFSQFLSSTLHFAVINVQQAVMHFVIEAGGLALTHGDMTAMRRWGHPPAYEVAHTRKGLHCHGILAVAFCPFWLSNTVALCCLLLTQHEVYHTYNQQCLNNQR